VIVDFHTHLLKWDDYVPDMRDFIARINPAYLEVYGDRHPTAAEFAAAFRADGVDRVVVLAEHAPASTGNLRSEYVAEFCAGDPALIPACCINPNVDWQPRQAFQRYVDELGMRLLKLMPSYGYFRLGDPRMWRIYEIAEARGVPILIHVGSSVFPGTRQRFCDPDDLQDVAREFPDLPFVLAHAGRGYWYEQCQFLAEHEPNVYLDLTGLPPARLLDLLPRLERLATKTVFGSDWPAVPKPVSDNLAAVRALPLSDAARAAILGGTAAHLLRLDRSHG
jgi:predicted TIM-barrel fold metal-dependent hydrolase